MKRARSISKIDLNGLLPLKRPRKDAAAEGAAAAESALLASNLIGMLPEHRFHHFYPACDLRSLYALSCVCRGYFLELTTAYTGPLWLPFPWRNVLNERVSQTTALAVGTFLLKHLRNETPLFRLMKASKVYHKLGIRSVNATTILIVALSNPRDKSIDPVSWKLTYTTMVDVTESAPKSRFNALGALPDLRVNDIHLLFERNHTFHLLKSHAEMKKFGVSNELVMNYFYLKDRLKQAEKELEGVQRLAAEFLSKSANREIAPYFLSPEIISGQYERDLTTRVGLLRLEVGAAEVAATREIEAIQMTKGIRRRV